MYRYSNPVLPGIQPNPGTANFCSTGTEDGTEYGHMVTMQMSRSVYR
jgi:hypothetical protein